MNTEDRDRLEDLLVRLGHFRAGYSTAGTCQGPESWVASVALGVLGVNCLFGGASRGDLSALVAGLLLLPVSIYFLPPFAAASRRRDVARKTRRFGAPERCVANLIELVRSIAGSDEADALDARLRAATAIAALGDFGHIYLMRVLDDADPRMSLWAGCALTGLPGCAGVAALQDALDNPAFSARRAAAHALWSVGDSLLRNGDFAGAAELILAGDETRAVVALAHALINPDPEIRRRASIALGQGRKRRNRIRRMATNGSLSPGERLDALAALRVARAIRPLRVYLRGLSRFGDAASCAAGRALVEELESRLDQRARVVSKMGFVGRLLSEGTGSLAAALLYAVSFVAGLLFIVISADDFGAPRHITAEEWASCLLLAVIALLGYLAGRIVQDRVEDAVPVRPWTRSVVTNVQPSESLVRASAEPRREQPSVLLRPSGASPAAPQSELLRPVVGDATHPGEQR